MLTRFGFQNTHQHRPLFLTSPDSSDFSHRSLWAQEEVCNSSKSTTCELSATLNYVSTGEYAMANLEKFNGINFPDYADHFQVRGLWGTTRVQRQTYSYHFLFPNSTVELHLLQILKPMDVKCYICNQKWFHKWCVCTRTLCLETFHWGRAAIRRAAVFRGGAERIACDGRSWGISDKNRWGGRVKRRFCDNQRRGHALHPFASIAGDGNENLPRGLSGRLHADWGIER